MPYHGHNVTVLWDRDGSRYGQGAGMRVYVDGRQAAKRATVGELTARVPAAVTPDRSSRPSDDAANPYGTGYPKPFASYTNGIDNVWDAVDGRIYYDDVPHNRWTNYRSPNAEDHLGVDFGVPTRVSDVRFYAYDDGGGVKAPASYRLEFWDGAAWREVPGQTRTPERPAGAALNRVTFPALTTTKIRLVFGNPPGAYVGVTELQAWSPAAGDATVDVTVSGQARSGDPAEVTTTFVNRGRTPATRVTASLAVPPGWSAEPVGSPKAHVVRPGGEFAVRWRVAPPAGTAPSPGAHPVRAAVEFDGSARAVSPYAQVTVGLDPDAYGKVEADDDFAADTSAGYTLYKPEGGEALPAVTVGGGRFAGGGAQPFFGLAAGPAALSSADAISVVTAGEFAGDRQPGGQRVRRLGEGRRHLRDRLVQQHPQAVGHQRAGRRPVPRHARRRPADPQARRPVRAGAVR